MVAYVGRAKANIAKLPIVCAERNPSDNQPILIQAGESGFYPAPSSLDVEGFNRRHGVTERERDAMLAGSMFGWEVPAADPDLAH